MDRKKRIRVMIAHHSNQEIARIQELLYREFPDTEIIGVATQVKELKNLFIIETPDLLLSSITLNKYSVLKVLDQVPSLNCEIVFMSHTEKYAIETFKYGAIAYLVSPFDNKQLKEAIQKAFQKKINTKTLSKFQDYLTTNAHSSFYRKIAISLKEEVIIINEQDIIYCKAHNVRNTQFVLTNKVKHIANKSISVYHKILSSTLFFRIHKSYIINLKYLVKIDKSEGNYCLLSNGSILPIASRRVKELVDLFKA